MPIHTGVLAHPAPPRASLLHLQIRIARAQKVVHGLVVDLHVRHAQEELSLRCVGDELEDVVLEERESAVVSSFTRARLSWGASSLVVVV